MGDRSRLSRRFNNFFYGLIDNKNFITLPVIKHWQSIPIIFKQIEIHFYLNKSQVNIIKFSTFLSN